MIPKKNILLTLGLWIGGAAVLLAPFAISAQENAPTPDLGKVLAEICGTKITVGDLENKINEIPIYARKNFLKVDGKKKILENMIKGEILYCAAKEAGYEKNAEIQAKVLETTKSIFQSEYFKREMKDSVLVKDQQIQDYYNSHKDEFRIPESRLVRHIQFSTRETAMAAKKRLESGEDFVKLCAAISEDKSTSDTGGNLGYIHQNSPLNVIGSAPAVNQWAFQAKASNLSDPIKTVRGWHIFKLDDVHPASFQPLDAVKADISDKFLITDADVEANYNNHKDEYISKERVAARHILVKDKATAEKILADLKAGKAFDQEARVNSQDNFTATKGGDLGFIYREGTIRGIGQNKAFEDALFSTKPNDYTIVQTDKGWHVVQVTSYEPVRQKSLAEVSSIIRNKLLRDARENALERAFDKMKDKYGVKVSEKYIVDTTYLLKETPQEANGGGAEMPGLPFLGQ